jgi:hypothetical protein
LLRHRLRLRFHPLTGGEQGFLAALQGGETFAAAVAAGEGGDGGAPNHSGDAAFDPSAALARFVAAEVIVECR